MHKTGYGTLIIFFLLLFSFTVFEIPAGGVQEDPLLEAEQLVEQREYNKALKVLTDILKQNPDRIEDVQLMLTRIRIEKENYNDRYEELIDVYGGDDVEAAYPIIKELEDLDPNPNEATRTSLVLARETAGFVFNNNRWVSIMEQAAGQIASGDYAAAAETYTTGFDLSRDIFSDGGYGNIVINDVFSRADNMSELTAEFTGLYPAMREKDSKLLQSFEQRSLDEYITESSDILPDLQRTAEIRELLKDTADYFIVQEDTIRKSSGIDKQIHYLIYMDRLLNGRTTIEDPEGITGAIELFWNEIYGNMVREAVSYSEELFNAAVESYKSGNLDESGTEFGNVVKIIENSNETLEFGSAYFESDSQFQRSGIYGADRAGHLAQQQYLALCGDAADTFFTIIEKRRILAELQERIDTVDPDSEDYRETGDSIRTRIAAESGDIEALLSDWQQKLQELRQSGTTGDTADKTVAVVQLPVEEYGTMLGKLVRMEIVVTANTAETDLARLEQDYSSAAAAVELSSGLIEGVPPEGESTADTEAAADFEVLYKYPDQALTRLLQAESDINSLIQDIERVDSGISSERAEVRQGDEVRAASGHAADLGRRSTALLAEAGRLADNAREQIFAAEKLKQEGERRIEESRLLIQRAQFAVAKERLEQAAAKFDESLSYLEDQVLRTSRDNEIPRLYEEIQVAENNLVVRQVREYLTQGKSSYSQGNFAAAQSVLIKAQSRWSDTNVEPNPEVEYWLTLTQTALSVTSGRIIASTDPLFVEMNQYLNQARRAFQNARTALESGRQADADSYFAGAEQSLLYVQQFFPFNEEARVLNLRISQYRNPEQFREVFGNDFRAARSLISANPQKAYIDLKDLEAIEPGYPGLQAAITEAEYAAGIKVRPPDPQKLARSTELYRLAYDIISRNVRSEFNVALSYLNEAISLNPDNNEAIRLKDRISTDVGGTATAVMSSADQQLYNEAVREFTAGNYLRARIIVENLLKDPVNQRNPRLIDLQERIERTR